MATLSTESPVIATPTVLNLVDDANSLSVTSVGAYPESVDMVNPEHDDKTENKVEAEITESTKSTNEEKEELIAEDETKIEAKADDSVKTEEVKTEPKEEVKAEDRVPKSVQERIDKAVKKQRIAERERDAERQAREELEARIAELETKIPATDKPNSEDFETEAEYLEALTDWKVEQKLKSLSAQGEGILKKQETEKKIEDAEKPYDTLDQFIDKGREKYADFDALVLQDKSFPLTDVMVDAVLDLETPHEVLYYLGKHHDESAEIAKMTIPKMAIALAKIDAKINAPAPKTIIKHVSKAPEPITPIEANGVIDVNPEKMTPKEYRAWREKQK
jgi:hypothetical protein